MTQARPCGLRRHF